MTAARNIGAKMNIENDWMAPKEDGGDEYLHCQQCGREFLFSKAERERYLKRGFDPPLRCPECRKHRSRLDQEPERDYRQRRRRGARDYDEYE